MNESIAAWEIQALKKALKKGDFVAFENMLTAKELTISEYFRHAEEWPQHLPTLHELSAYLCWCSKTPHRLAWRDMAYEILGQLLRATRSTTGGQHV